MSCFFDIARTSFKPGKASAALAGSELRYLSLYHRALTFNAPAAWPIPTKHAAYCTAEAAGFATFLSGPNGDK